MVNLVNIQCYENGAEGGANCEVTFPQMLFDVGVVLDQLLLNLVDQLHQFGHVLGVNSAPIFAVQEINEAPESFLLVLNVHQKHCSNVVETLHVANLGVVIGES